MKYQVEISETLQKTVVVDADSPKAAIRQAKLLYDMDIVELGSENVVERTFEVI